MAALADDVPGDDDLLFQEDEPENTNGNGQAPVAVNPPPANLQTTRRATSVAPGSAVKEVITRTAVVPAGTASPITGQVVGRINDPGSTPHASTPGQGLATVREWLRRATENESEQRRTANWKIVVKRLTPLVHKGTALNTTEPIADLSIMTLNDVQDAVRGSHGGGKYRADILNDAGGWQMGWQFQLSGEPITALANQMSGFGPHNDPMHEIRVKQAEEEMALRRREQERKDKEYEEDRAERKAKREREEREAQQQNPLMQYILKMEERQERQRAEDQRQRAEDQRRFEALVEKLAKPDSAPDMLKLLLASLEAKKEDPEVQIKLAQMKADSEKEIARLNAEASTRASEAVIKANEAAQAKSEKWLELVFKNQTKEKNTLGEMESLFKLADVIRDRMAPQEVEAGGGMEAFAPLVSAAAPAIAQILAKFATPNTPTGDLAARAAGVAPGQPIDYDRLAASLAPHVVKASKPALPQQAGPTQSEAVITTDAQGNSVMSVQQPAPANVPVPAPELDVTAETGTTREERRRDKVRVAMEGMIADAADKVAEASWVQDALATWGDLLDEIAATKDDDSAAKVIERYADPVMWGRLRELMVTNAAANPYYVWIKGVRELKAGRLRQRAQQAQAPRQIG